LLKTECQDPIALIFAIPDHPWMGSLAGRTKAATRYAAVRIAMTVGERGEHEGQLYRVFREVTPAEAQTWSLQGRRVRSCVSGSVGEGVTVLGYWKQMRT